MPLALSIAAFPNGEEIPRVHTCEGQDLSPEITWAGEPDQTKSFVLIVDDPDAPGKTWNHWLLYDIPPSTHSLEEGFQPGQVGLSGRNDFGRSGYGGPCPPSGTHRYYFKVYALDTKLDLKPGATKKQLVKAMEGHILAQGELMGKYARSR